MANAKASSSFTIGRRTAGSIISQRRAEENDDGDACDRMKLELMTRSDGHYQCQLGPYINIAGGNFALTSYKQGNRTSVAVAG
jgi:hypothetical protein